MFDPQNPTNVTQRRFVLKNLINALALMVVTYMDTTPTTPEEPLSFGDTELVRGLVDLKDKVAQIMVMQLLQETLLDQGMFVFPRETFNDVFDTTQDAANQYIRDAIEEAAGGRSLTELTTGVPGGEDAPEASDVEDMIKTIFDSIERTARENGIGFVSSVS